MPQGFQKKVIGDLAKKSGRPSGHPCLIFRTIHKQVVSRAVYSAHFLKLKVKSIQILATETTFQLICQFELVK